MRILVSAYACAPGKGSEPGIGWNWATAAARNHQVWVLTRSDNQEAIEAELQQRPVGNLTFVFHQVPRRFSLAAKLAQSIGIGNIAASYLWQWSAKPLAMAMDDAIKFDLAHHVTYGGIRHWTFLAWTNIPFIWGPLGGGEEPPIGLIRGLPRSGQIREVLRLIANRGIRFDPFIRRTSKRAVLVLAKTPESARALPSIPDDRLRLMTDVAIEMDSSNQGRKHEVEDRVRLVYVGRLLDLKGVDLVIEAMAKLANTHPNITLTLIGDGPDKDRLIRTAQARGISERVLMKGWLPRLDVLKDLANYHVFVFPSLHDSSGNAVLEAMAVGLPVVCLDIGGPAMIVSDECGFRIRSASRTAAVDGVAAAIKKLADEPSIRTAMSAAAVRRVQDHFLLAEQEKRIAELYQDASGRLP